MGFGIEGEVGVEGTLPSPLGVIGPIGARVTHPEGEEV